MIDLSTDYLGLTLAHPLVPSASPFTHHLDSAKRLEDAGAAALVMHSLFEEQINAEQQQLERFIFEQSLGYSEASAFHPMPARFQHYQDRYLQRVQQLKQQLAIPIIASLNGSHLGGWLACAALLQQAGADALELNLYQLPADSAISSAELENSYVAIVRGLKQHCQLPLTVKLSAQLSAPQHFIKQLQAAGANGVVLFNRFYQPDIDLDTLEVLPTLQLSSAAEALLRIRWTALSYGNTTLSLAVTGGFHDTPEVIKALLAGADVVHLCSALLQKGPAHLTQLLQSLQQWLEEKEYASITQLKGSVCHRHAIDPSAYERANYWQVLDSYTPAPGVLR